MCVHIVFEDVVCDGKYFRQQHTARPTRGSRDQDQGCLARARETRMVMDFQRRGGSFTSIKKVDLLVNLVAFSAVIYVRPTDKSFSGAN